MYIGVGHGSYIRTSKLLLLAMDKIYVVAFIHEKFCKYSKFQINFQEANKPPEAWFELKVNPHIYVTGLPKDVTIEEVSCCHCFFYYHENPKALKRTESSDIDYRWLKFFLNAALLRR